MIPLLKINKYLKIIPITICLFLTLFVGKTTLAGSVNGNESRVIGVAKGTFEYQGEKYVAKQGYIDKLVAKLQQDDVDLTADQANQMIAGIYANVETGVREGYIVKVGDSITDHGQNENDPSENVSSNDTYQDVENSNEQSEEDKNQVARIMEETEKEVGESMVSYQAPLIIKDTGFHLQGTYYVLLGGLIILILCTYTIMKSKITIFANNHEEETKKE